MNDVAPDPNRCPLCGQSNRCTQADPALEGQSCWCFSTRIDRNALERIPPELVDRACLCPRCAAGLSPQGMDDENA
ncbi:cysteine-rich CWC family protein [Pseudomonas nicosulfuronedens]|uniref:DNA or RNA helicase of superfamily II n=1 Tax=Pseudomonas nicosulfuronedens TaxID=2571105 RepID=A0A5R9R9B8_9PSED|nr:cysteine-rich CWC family protein [Pseudomonas nicosulfuronedens]MDH1007554.1 cysteine-rich CWC family protein [Pseudomonas nicosulfuronedens]MDH1977599.1 cysteine-rich CWC family protein [Pseudomonas nicosulfuronedens]MDH2025801.1 cysteine-rich CWC family protein [Pseudomonas nicosulfuronedens]TLX79707.1 DNA or RNA helicase of superfamily II [Pseudomonas nicosulfuronedens]